MPKEFWIAIAIGAAVVVAIALFLGRRLRIKHGETEVEANQPDSGSNQVVSARGPGSSVARVKQSTSAGLTGIQKIEAEKGGSIEDVNQKKGK